MFELTVRDGEKSYTIRSTDHAAWSMLITNEDGEGMSLKGSALQLCR